MENPKFLREEEAAQMLAISVKTLRAWRLRGGTLIFHKFGRAVRYSVADLKDYVDATARRSTSERANCPSEI